MRETSALLLAASLLSACADAGAEWGGTVTDSAGIAVMTNPPSADWTLQPRPAVVEELRIGSISGDPAYQFTAITGVDVDADGNIYVLDQQSAQVRIFDPAGRHLRSLGRLGSGPGEITQSAMAVVAAPDASIHVFDLMGQRITSMDREGNGIGSIPINIMEGMPVRVDITPEKEMLIQTRSLNIPGMGGSGSEPKDYLILRAPGSERADTLLQLESGQTVSFGAGGMPQIRLFEPEPMWAVLEDGRIVLGRNDTFRVQVLREDGSVERVIAMPAERRPVTEADREALRTLMRETMEAQVRGGPPEAMSMIQVMLQSIQFADHYPAFAALLGGPGGTVWSQRIRTADDARRDGGEFTGQDMGARTWDVFDAEGRLLGPIELPERFTPLRFRGDRLYGVLRDELDVQHLVRLRVEGLTGGAS